MKVAIPIETVNNTMMIGSSFGRTPDFLIYETTTKTYLKHENSAASLQGGAGIKAAQILLDLGIQAVILPQCGENAMAMFSQANIVVCQSVGNNIEENMTAFANHELKKLESAHPGFHHHQ